MSMFEKRIINEKGDIPEVQGKVVLKLENLTKK